ncbi:MAG: DNA mismatch repair protein MutS [Myxococcota bacterium]
MTPAPQSGQPEDSYRARLDERRSTLKTLEVGDLRFANLRTAVFVAAVGIALGSWVALWWSALWLLVPGFMFVGLMIAHDRLDRRRQRVLRAIAYYERGLRRLSAEWHGEGNTRDDWVGDDHPYATDLDLFGIGSLFDLMGTARTPAGQSRLVSWLSAPAETAAIRDRQSAVRELRDRVLLREDLALLADGIVAQVHPEVLTGWGEHAPRLPRETVLRALAWSLSGLAVVAAILWPLTPLGPVPLLAVALVEVAVGRWLRDPVDAITGSIENPQRELKVLAEVLARVETESVESSLLVRQVGRLRSEGQSASGAIAALIRLVVWLDAMRNQFFYPIGFLLMWRLHFAIAIERWRQRHGAEIAGWLDALAEFEALAATAGFAFENRDFVEPELVDDAVCFDAEALGHPLPTKSTVVCNDLRLGDETRMLLVSGSNMSGKSTLLRTVGLNAVLALAGAPVRAKRLRLSPLAVGASIRTQDSLLGGKSRFYAEVLRLKQVLDLAHGGMPALFLLDEILHGTNSHDRRIGASALLSGFLETSAVGLITTHDLAIADAVSERTPTVRNVHFVDELIDDELNFDYILRDGVVQRSNAIAVMRAVGLRV